MSCLIMLRKTPEKLKSNIDTLLGKYLNTYRLYNDFLLAHCYTTNI